MVKTHTQFFNIKQSPLNFNVLSTQQRPLCFPQKMLPLRWDGACAVFRVEDVDLFGEPWVYGTSVMNIVRIYPLCGFV